jgi:negative regulator of sigma E activity
MNGIREEMQDEVVGHLFEDDELVHPWRYWHTTKDSGIPF